MARISQGIKVSQIGQEHCIFRLRTSSKFEIWVSLRIWQMQPKLSWLMPDEFRSGIKSKITLGSGLMLGLWFILQAKACSGCITGLSH